MLTDQLINMIYLKREPFDLSIAFRNLLMFETKACMQQSLGVMGASISSNTPKEVIASVISEHFRVNTEFVWSKLDNATKEILKQLAEGDSLTYVEHSHDETHFSEIEKSSLVVAFFPDRKKNGMPLLYDRRGARSTEKSHQRQYRHIGILSPPCLFLST